MIASVLRELKGRAVLVDMSDHFPQLKRQSGLFSWKVQNDNQEVFDRWEDIPASSQSVIQPSCFPPSREEAENLHLDYCMRFLPHYNNSGGFFIAVLEKCHHINENEFESENDNPFCLEGVLKMEQL